MPVPDFHAFWSYSRTTELHGGEDLHAAMQASLNEAMAPQTLTIFRDTAPQPGNGNGSGTDWHRELVRAISRSVLFFWVQSPRWLHRPLCVFEFEVFRDRVWRAANAFAPDDAPATFQALWTSMVVPVRWLDATEDQLHGIPGPASAAIAHDWGRLNVIRSLNLPDIRRSNKHAGDVYSMACVDSAAVIHGQLSETLGRYRISYANWISMVERDSHPFEQAWVRQLTERRLVGAPDADMATIVVQGSSLLDAQAGLARRLTGGRARMDLYQLGLTMVLIPQLDNPGKAFWCASAPLANRLASKWAGCFGDAFGAEPGPNGALRWSAAAVIAMRPALLAEDLDIPDADQTASLSRLRSEERSTLHRLGLQSVPRDFWSRTADGALLPPEGRSDNGSLVLVSEI